jgi:hypothetical protein
MIGRHMKVTDATMSIQEIARGSPLYHHHDGGREDDTGA